MFSYISLTFYIFCYCNDVFTAQDLHTHGSFWIFFCLTPRLSVSLGWHQTDWDTHIIYSHNTLHKRKGCILMRIVLKYCNFPYLIRLLSILLQSLSLYFSCSPAILPILPLPFWCLIVTRWIYIYMYPL